MSESTTTTEITQAEWRAASAAGLLFATPGTNAQDTAIHKFAEAVRAEQRQRVDFALAHLRMAFDLRNVGDIRARVYERDARRALAELAGVPYDLLREEATRAGEVPA